MKTLHWTSQFSTFSQDVITIYIYSDDYTGEVVELTPSATPLTLDDDSNRDALCPMRLQTGNLEFVNLYNLNDLMPATDIDHFVAVTCMKGGQGEERIIWTGFMQAQSFSEKSWEYGSTVSFPVVDMLGVLSCGRHEGDFGNYGAQRTFASLMTEGIRWVNALVPEDFAISRIVIPSQWTKVDGTDPLAALHVQVSRMLYFEDNDAENIAPEDYEPWRGLPYQNTFSDVAALYGWTVTGRPEEIVFADPEGGTGYVAYNVNTGQAEAYTWPAASRLSDLQICDSDTSFEHEIGAGDVRIIAKSSPVSEIDLGVQLKTLPYVRTTGQGSGDAKTADIEPRRHVYDATGQMWRMTLRGCYFSESGDDSHPELAKLDVSPYNPKRDANVPTYEGLDARPDYDGGVDIQVCRFSPFSAGMTSYNFKAAFELRYVQPMYTEPMTHNRFVCSDFYGDETEKQFTFLAVTGPTLPPVSQGALNLNIQSLQGGLFSTHREITMKLRVGSHYWNGHAWTTQNATFSWGWEGKNFEKNKTLDMPYEDADDYLVIPIENVTLSGTINLELIFDKRFLQYRETYGQFFDIALKYCNVETYLSEGREDSLTYYAAGDDGLSEGKDIELNFATMSDSLQFGNGTLSFDNQWVTGYTLAHNGTGAIPERILLDKAVRLCKKQTTRIDTAIRIPIDEAPRVGQAVTYGGHPWVIMHREIDVANDEVRFTALQIR